MTIPPPVFRPACNITRASHVVHRVCDLAKSRAFYVDTLGFVVSAIMQLNKCSERKRFQPEATSL